VVSLYYLPAFWASLVSGWRKPNTSPSFLFHPQPPRSSSKLFLNSPHPCGALLDQLYGEAFEAVTFLVGLEALPPTTYAGKIREVDY
jgi:hypothetical protein